ncbi:hypothetical protein [Catenulispora rubra]|uniref:hypothetical protein n=1 Tax=Catenulispora rubra TaxID=280293 RepID=UPI0018926967|nr:hypothetical protein [Catenulispora rubra]
MITFGAWSCCLSDGLGGLVGVRAARDALRRVDRPKAACRASASAARAARGGRRPPLMM